MVATGNLLPTYQVWERTEPFSLFCLRLSHECGSGCWIIVKQASTEYVHAWGIIHWGFQAPKHVRRETEEGGEEHGGRKREWELGDALKETKALSFWGPFCYCRPLCARLLGLLHNAGPLWAAHHWLSCHFKLASFLRTAAPKAWTHLSWKKWSGHTHTFCTEWVDKEVVDKMGTQGEPQTIRALARNNCDLISAVALPSQSHSHMHTQTFLWHTFMKRGKKHVLMRNAFREMSELQARSVGESLQPLSATVKHVICYKHWLRTLGCTQEKKNPAPIR